MWPRLSSTTLTDQVYGVLRDRILPGDWDVGRFIREQEISDNLGVSRTPVRAALGQLASEGFLERIPHRGFRLPRQSATDLLDLYPILASLEVLAAQQSFPQISEEELAELRAVNRAYHAAYERADIREGIELNNRFHHLLSEGSHNERLCEMLDELRAEVTRLEVWAFSNMPQWDVSVREHEKILDAVEAGDYDLALATTEENRLMTYTDFGEHIGDGRGDTRLVDAEEGQLMSLRTAATQQGRSKIPNNPRGFGSKKGCSTVGDNLNFSCNASW